MSFATPQVLSKDTATDVDTNTSSFVQRFADADHSEFSVAGLTLPASEILSIRHSDGKDGEQRSVVRIDKTVVDAYGVAATGSVYINWIRPPNTALTNAIMLEITNKLVDLCVEGGSNANVTAILNREV